MSSETIRRDLERADRDYLLIALTGSIGTGKSAVAERLARHGATVIDADILARRAVEPGAPALREIVAHFGAAVIQADGSLNRKRLGEIIFNDRAERAWLERCLHPRIRSLFYEALTTELSLRATPTPTGTRRLVVYVIPLFFESPAPRDEFDYVVVVAASRATSIARIIARDSTSPELAERKVASQLPIEQKTGQADFVVHNDGPLSDLDGAVATLYRDLQKLPPRPRSAP
jgi:dephospho-CoA kinase